MISPPPRCPFCQEPVRREQVPGIPSKARTHGDPGTPSAVNAPCATCGNEFRPRCLACGHQGGPVAFCQQCGEPLGLLGTRKAGAYRLVKLLGTGGQGRTYHALDAGGRHVAVKELLGEIKDRAKVQELFAREAQALNSLDHPAIPHLIDYFVDQGRRIQVMDLVLGASLERLALEAGGRLPEHRVVAWMLELCDVLDYLHGAGIIHRDIKPGNILIRRSAPHVALIDFGAVKEAGAPPGTIIATPGFAPFEQSQGSPLPQSDLYAVGCTMVALVTGKHPATAYDTARGTFPTLEALGMSPALARVVREATTFIAAERLPSARALKRKLASV